MIPRNAAFTLPSRLISSSAFSFSTFWASHFLWKHIGQREDVTQCGIAYSDPQRQVWTDKLTVISTLDIVFSSPQKQSEQRKTYSENRYHHNKDKTPIVSPPQPFEPIPARRVSRPNWYLVFPDQFHSPPSFLQRKFSLCLRGMQVPSALSRRIVGDR